MYFGKITLFYQRYLFLIITVDSRFENGNNMEDVLNLLLNSEIQGFFYASTNIFR